MGAALCGYLADRFGRRPVCTTTVFACVCINLLIALLGGLHWVHLHWNERSGSVRRW